VLAFVFEVDGGKGAKPILQIFEKSAVEVGAHFAVFSVTDNIKQAAPFQSIFQQVGKGKFLEGFQHLPDIAGAEKIGVA